MEECLPGVDYASIKADPSMTHNLPATSTPSPAVEQTQAEGERSQLLCSQWTHGSHLVSCSLQASPDTTLLSSLPRPTVCPELSRAGEVTQPPSQFPQSKRKRVSSATSLGERRMKVYHFLIPGQCHWVSLVPRPFRSTRAWKGLGTRLPLTGCSDINVLEFGKDYRCLHSLI